MDSQHPVNKASLGSIGTVQCVFISYQQETQFRLHVFLCESRGPLARYVKLRVVVRRECWEHFPRHRLQRKPLISDPGMNHGTCATPMPWCMLRSLTHGGEENIPRIPGACATRNFTYLVKGPCQTLRGIQDGLHTQILASVLFGFFFW